MTLTRRSFATATAGLAATFCLPAWAQMAAPKRQFLSLATGGPAQYDGKDMKSTHAGMGIGNPEFDAVIGDLKASLDKLQIATQEQKELLAIIESTRPQIVTQR